jgi:hypothetical protein
LKIYNELKDAQMNCHSLQKRLLYDRRSLGQIAVSARSEIASFISEASSSRLPKNAYPMKANFKQMQIDFNIMKTRSD